MLFRSCYARIIHVGEENYANRIASEVKEVRAVNSRLLNAMKRITRLSGYAIIPLGILLFLEAWGFRGDSIQESVITSSAALLGMLPKGLVLLISVSLAAGVSRMAKHKVLIQDLYSLETLANVDTLCLDKTGTITTGDLKVEALLPLCDEAETDMEYIRSFLHYSDDNNATYQALCARASSSSRVSIRSSPLYSRACCRPTNKRSPRCGASSPCITTVSASLYHPSGCTTNWV